MKCYYHPDKDAVGTCVQCGKTACRECIDDLGGALLCKGCQALAREAESHEEQLDISRAKKSIKRSWIITSVVSFFLIVGLILPADPKQNPGAQKLALSLFGIYWVWSAFWGWKVVWPWWRSVLSSIGCFIIANPLALFLLVLMSFYIPFLGATFYGMLGGAVFQYRKYKRLAESSS